MLAASEMIPVHVGFSLLAVLGISSVTDVAWHRIPNVLLFIALAIALVLRAIAEGPFGILLGISGLVIGLAFLLPLYALGSMGAGDVKLLGVVGVFLGPWGACVAGIATLISGAILGIVFIAWRNIEPVLAYQTWKLLRILDSKSRSNPAPSCLVAPIRGSRFAYAPAIAGGTIFAMWQQGMLTQLALVS